MDIELLLWGAGGLLALRVIGTLPALYVGMELRLRLAKVTRVCGGARLQTWDVFIALAVVVVSLRIAWVLVALGWGGTAFVFAVLGAALAPTCRLRVDVIGERGELSRRVLGVRWYRKVMPSVVVWSDGWGDEMDPVALLIATGPEAVERDAEGSYVDWVFELGWELGDGERAAELVRAMEEARRG